MGVLRGVGVDFGLEDLRSVVEDHHLHLSSSVVDPREGVVVDGVNPCGVDVTTSVEDNTILDDER